MNTLSSHYDPLLGIGDISQLTPSFKRTPHTLRRFEFCDTLAISVLRHSIGCLEVGIIALGYDDNKPIFFLRVSAIQALLHLGQCFGRHLFVASRHVDLDAILLSTCDCVNLVLLLTPADARCSLHPCHVDDRVHLTSNCALALQISQRQFVHFSVGNSLEKAYSRPNAPACSPVHVSAPKVD